MASTAQLEGASRGRVRAVGTGAQPATASSSSGCESFLRTPLKHRRLFALAACTVALLGPGPASAVAEDVSAGSIVYGETYRKLIAAFPDGYFDSGPDLTAEQIDRYEACWGWWF